MFFPLVGSASILHFLTLLAHGNRTETILKPFWTASSTFSQILKEPAAENQKGAMSEIMPAMTAQ